MTTLPDAQSRRDRVLTITTAIVGGLTTAFALALGAVAFLS